MRSHRFDSAGLSPEQWGRRLEEYRPVLQSLAERRINRQLRTRVSASDLVQETMFEAVRDRQAFRGSTLLELHGWLRRILCNNLSRAIDRHLRTKKRDVRRDVSYFTCAAATASRDFLLGETLPSRVESPSTIVERNENVQRLRSMLARLSADQQRVIELRHFHGLKFKEIGAQMNRSASAAKMLWIRSIARLRATAETVV